MYDVDLSTPIRSLRGYWPDFKKEKIRLGLAAVNLIFTSSVALIFFLLWKKRQNLHIWIQFGIVVTYFFENVVRVAGMWWVVRTHDDAQYMEACMRQFGFLLFIVYMAYFILTLNIFFLLVLNLDLWQSFRSIRFQKRSVNSDRSRFLVALAFCLIISAISTAAGHWAKLLATAGVDVQTTGAFYNVKIEAVRLIVVIILWIVNAIVFIWTLIGLRKAIESTKPARQNVDTKNRERFYMYARLFGVMMGMSALKTTLYILFVLQAHYKAHPFVRRTSSVTIWLVVLHPLEGLLASLAMVANGRTITQIREVFKQGFIFKRSFSSSE
ncbi:hypothetical protein Fcan01_10277 [Folsomia candida]|uniref:G-protein coupled receptors family 1 profile domain-containing protein n=1 Tax=Folsomia candida TaxID=158441 RepID=A0A226EAQ2_FOLCA|nr:hypothetical protein Fcan01_10277 [Folsomia candida]